MSNIFNMDIWVDTDRFKELYKKLDSVEKTLVQYIEGFQKDGCATFIHDIDENEVLEIVFDNNVALMIFTINNMVDKGIIKIIYNYEYPDNHRINKEDDKELLW